MTKLLVPLEIRPFRGCQCPQSLAHRGSTKRGSVCTHGWVPSVAPCGRVTIKTKEAYTLMSMHTQYYIKNDIKKCIKIQKHTKYSTFKII